MNGYIRLDNDPLQQLDFVLSIYQYLYLLLLLLTEWAQDSEIYAKVCWAMLL